eukprot:7146564-Prorocentrum_lima.AAC.1
MCIRDSTNFRGGSRPGPRRRGHGFLQGPTEPHAHGRVEGEEHSSHMPCREKGVHNSTAERYRTKARRGPN